jgi:hypothetical protein
MWRMTMSDCHVSNFNFSRDVILQKRHQTVTCSTFHMIGHSDDFQTIAPAETISA